MAIIALPSCVIAADLLDGLKMGELAIA